MDYLHVDRTNSTLFFRLRGSITLEHTQALKREADAALSQAGLDTVIVDLSRTDSLDSSGIGFLVTMNTGAKKKGMQLYLLQPGPQIRKTLEMVQLLDYFQIMDNEDELWAVISD